MADYQEFRRKARSKRIQRKALRIAGALAALFVAGSVGWFLRGLVHPSAVSANGTKPVIQSVDSSTAVSTASSVADSAVSAASAASAVSAAPAPAEAGSTSFTPAANADTAWNSSAYAVRVLNEGIVGQDDGTTAMDFRLAALPACGVVDISYFDNVTFVGDSLTQGLQLYSEGLPNSHYCAYKGIGPNAIVNGTTVKDVHGVEQIPMDALVASQPNVVYILLGTNVLVGAGSYDSFMAYYNQLIDMIQTALPGIPIYIQSITPVRPEVAASKPGLENGRLRQINDEVAAMALSKGCYFIDLWETLADADGNLNAEYAQPDGIHLKPVGYQAWVTYLQTHTKYMPGVIYAPGTSYYIEQ